MLSTLVSFLLRQLGRFLPGRSTQVRAIPTAPGSLFVRELQLELGALQESLADPGSNYKVAIYLDSLRGYGADKTLLKLVNGLASKNINVDLVLAKPPEQTQQIHPAVSLFSLQSSRFNPIKNMLGLANYLKQQHPHILFSSIHFNNIVAACAVDLANVSTKLIVRQANTLRRQLRDYPFPIGPILYTLTRMTYARADLVVCQCIGMISDLTEYMNVDRHKLQVIYNPTVTKDIFEQAQQPPDHYWLNPKNFPVLLAVGRLKPQKDFHTLIQAFAQVKQNVGDVRLIILGEGPQQQELEQLAVELGIRADIDFAGFQSNPYAFMATADLFVSSSRYEGLSNALIEALALGKTIVATDCDGGSSEILKYGRYGMLVPVGSPDHLAEAICLSLRHPVTNVHQPESIREFVQNTQIEKYIDMFTAIVDQEQHRSLRSRSKRSSEKLLRI